MANDSSKSTGIGFWGALLLILITLKLLGKITWSWWLVLFPVWAAIGLMILIFIIAVIFEVRKKNKLRKQLNKWTMPNGSDTTRKSKWAGKLEEMQQMQKKRKDRGNGPFKI